jgi:Protein of unknown function (DUF998)
LEYDTLTGVGWTPGDANGVQYPSSLALGPLGWMMMANFGMLGLLIIGLAAGLYRNVQQRLTDRIGPVLLGIAGLGEVLSVFPTDHGPANAPATWHGVVHNLGFALFFFSALLSFMFMTASFWRARRWRRPKWLALMAGVGVLGIVLLAVLVPVINQFALILLLLLGVDLFGVQLRWLGTEQSAQ